MSFNEECLDKFDEFRVELVALRPQPFLDQLRVKSVLTYNDSQEIMNDRVHPTTARQMGAMLDMLKSKGPRAYKMFIEVLASENPTLYKRMTGQDAPVIPVLDLHRGCRCGNIFNLEQLTEALKRKSQLEADLTKLKNTNNKLMAERRVTNEKLQLLWEQYNIEMDKNKDRDRLEAERNDMMEQLTNVTAKALSYKEDLEVVKRDLHKLRREQLVDRQDLEKARKGLYQQRQRSMQIEHTKIRMREELQEKVDQLEQELRKQPHRRISQPLPVKFINKEAGNDITSAPINQQLLNLQTDLEILSQDREQAITKAEESAERAYQVTKELHQTEERLEQIEKENEDLWDNLQMKRDEIEMQKSFVVLAEEGRAQAIAERDQALEEKKVQTEKCALLMLQRDKLFDDQRILRSKWETLNDKNSLLSAQLVKYKRKYRGQMRQDNVVQDQESIESSSSDDVTKSYDLPTGDQSEEVSMNTGTSESSESANKRDSSTTSSSQATCGNNANEDSDYENPLNEIPQTFRQRSKPIPSIVRDRPLPINTDELFSDFGSVPHGSLPELTTDEDRPSTTTFSYPFPRKPYTESTKVHANGDSIRRRELLLGSYSMHQEQQRVMKRGKKKDKKPHGLKRRSKSFNDLANLTFDDNTNLDLELAAKEQGSRYGRGLVHRGRVYGRCQSDRSSVFSEDYDSALEASLEMSDGILGDIESSIEVSFEEFFRTGRPRKLSSKFFNKLLGVGKKVRSDTVGRKKRPSVFDEF